MSKAMEDVVAERRRQVDVERHTHLDDDGQVKGEIVQAALAYLNCMGFMWQRGWLISAFKPTTKRRNLVKATALIIAEIERLDRAEDQEKIVPLGSPEYQFPFDCGAARLPKLIYLSTPTGEQQRVKEMFMDAGFKADIEYLNRAILQLYDVAEYESAAKAFHELSEAEKTDLPTRKELNSYQGAETDHPQTKSACSTAIEAMNRALAFIEYQKEGLSSARVFVPGTPRVKNQLKEAIGGLEKLLKTGQAAIDEPDQSSDAPGLQVVAEETSLSGVGIQDGHVEFSSLFEEQGAIITDAKKREGV